MSIDTTNIKISVRCTTIKEKLLYLMCQLPDFYGSTDIKNAYIDLNKGDNKNSISPVITICSKQGLIDIIYAGAGYKYKISKEGKKYFKAFCTTDDKNVNVITKVHCLLKYMKLHNATWQPSQIIVSHFTEYSNKNCNSTTSRDVIMAMLHDFYKKGYVNKKQVGDKHLYRINTSGIDKLLLLNNPKENVLQCSDILDSDLIDFVNKSNGWISAKDTALFFGISTQNNSGGLGTKLSVLSNAGKCKRKKVGYIYMYKKIDDSVHEMKKPAFEGGMLRKRIDFLIENDMELVDIQQICFDALEKCVDEYKEVKLDDEIKYLNENNYLIMDEYNKLKAQVEDLKDEKNKLIMSDISNRNRADRNELNRTR